MLLSILMLATCAGRAKPLLLDPVKLSFPLIASGSLDIEGHVVGQPRGRDGIVYFATREGYVTAVVIPSRGILWRIKTDHSVSVSPELAGEAVHVLDDGGILYTIRGNSGEVIGQTTLDRAVTTAIRVIEGGMIIGTAEGRLLVLDPGGWGYQPPGPGARATAGPVPVYFDEGNFLILFGRSDGLLQAVDHKGRPVWEFRAAGAIAADPAAAGGRVFFGDSDRMFYCLDAATGKVKWRRRLQGAPLHPAVIRRRRVAVSASNSVVYFLSRKGGSIVAWEAVPSRIIYPPAVAGPSLLVSAAAPDLMALDIATGRIIGRHSASGPLAAGALWVPPFIVLFEEDPDSGGQRMVLLRSR